jgi:hypothetical protein
MTTMTATMLKQVFSVRWKPNKDLALVALSWLLVVGALYTATVIVGTEAWGGMAYFVLYAVIGATLFGIGLPLYWMVVVRQRPLADLGLTTRWLGLSIVLQLLFAALQYMGTHKALPPLKSSALNCVVSIRILKQFSMRCAVASGRIRTIGLRVPLYSAYHIGYGMPASEMIFLFFIGVMFAVVFRLTKNIFILWPVFQPMGQLVTLVKDGLKLPLLASIGFFEVLIVMLVLVWLAARYHKKHPGHDNAV